MTRRALVIGGSGFLGRHALAQLADAGYITTVLDRPGAPAPSVTESGYSAALIEGSVTNRADVDAAFEAASPDVVLLLAAYSTGRRGLVVSGELHPEAATMTNVVGLLNTLETAKAARIRRLVWTSSTTVYASADRYPDSVDESDLVNPRSLYAASKVFGEQLVRTYRDHHQLDVVAIRPTLVWGPGIQYRGVQAALGEMIYSAASGKPVTVTANSEPWDLIYVKDAASALVAAMSAEVVPPLVITNGYTASIDDVRDAILDQVPDAPITVAGAGPRLDFPLVDSASAESFGFSPRYELAASVADYLATERQAETKRKEST